MANNSPGAQPETWVFAQSFDVFDEETAPSVESEFAFLVAEAIFDYLTRDRPAWVEHSRRFPPHDCSIETTCEYCFCCESMAAADCQCGECRCGETGSAHGQEFKTLEEVVLAMAQKKLALK